MILLSARKNKDINIIGSRQLSCIVSQFIKEDN